MGDLDCSNLLCQEDESCFFTGDVDEDGTLCQVRYSPCFVLQNEDVEYTEQLIERESSFGCTSDASSSIINCSPASHRWLSRARFSAVGWILNTRAAFGFRFHTAYLAVTYFDQFLSKRSIDDDKFWAIRLLSVACLSLAAKMEECKVPSLSDFPVEDYCFENKVIQRMELFVLSTLDWRMGSTTPFSYLHYFTNKFCGESTSNEVVSKAMELTVATMKEISLLDHRPSVIAAAAVLAADCRQSTRKELEVKMQLIPSWSAAEKEQLLSCYILMQEMEVGRVKTPKQVISPASSSMDSSSIHDADKNSEFIFAGGSKRRLTFRDCDCPVKKICQSSQRM